MKQLSLNIEPARASRWKYVYCVVALSKAAAAAALDSSQIIGINDEPVYAIRFKDLAAIVSSSTEKLYEIMDHGMTHQRVIETISKNLTVLPLAFGQVATEEDIKSFLRLRYPELLEIIDRFSGKVELGLKVTWKMQSVLAEIGRSSERARALKSEIMSKRDNATSSYSKRIELGRIVQEELEGRGRSIVSEIYNTLLPIAYESKVNEPLREEMILNASFLVETRKEKEFDTAVDGIEKKFGDRVSLKYVSSPPYDFVGLNMNNQ